MEFGMGPEIWFLASPRYSNLVNESPKHAGIGPWSSFEERNKDSSAVALERDSGIYPVNPLERRSRTLKRTHLPSSSGRGPLRRLFDKSSSFMLFQLLTRTIGNVPVNELPHSDKTSRFSKASSSGSGPWS